MASRRTAACIALVWATAALTSATVARYTRVGPYIGFGGAHGVHLGDAAVVLLSAWMASGVTGRLLRVAGADGDDDRVLSMETADGSGI